MLMNINVSSSHLCNGLPAVIRITCCNLIFLHKLQMDGITNREFAERAQNGLNYLTWASDVEIFVTSRELMHMIGTGATQDTAAQNVQALHFLRHHLCSTLKNEYMAERNALDLWKALKLRFERLKFTVRPQQRRSGCV